MVSNRQKSDLQYVNSWWLKKLQADYEVEQKHIAAGQLLTEASLPLVDLGAGTGVFMRLLEEKFPTGNITGVELSDLAISNKICQSPIIQQNINTWRSDSTVKTVSLIDVIEHIPDPEPLIQQLCQQTEHILIACPNFNFIKARVDILLGKIPFQNRTRRGGHVYWCQLKSLRALFDRTGLVIKQENHLYPKNYMPWIRTLLNLAPATFAHEFVFLLQVKRQQTNA